MKVNWQALWEAVKLPLRVFVLSLIPVAITWLSGLNQAWAGIAITFLVVLDKYIHEAEVAKPVSKQKEGIGGVRGLTGF